MCPAPPDSPRDEDLLDLSDVAEEDSASPAELPDPDDLDASFEQELEELFAEDLGEDTKAAPAAKPTHKKAETFDDALLLEPADEVTAQAAPASEEALPDIDLALPEDEAAGAMDQAGLDDLIDNMGSAKAAPAAAPETTGEAEPELLLLDDEVLEEGGAAPADEPVLDLGEVAEPAAEPASAVEADEPVLDLDDLLAEEVQPVAEPAAEPEILLEPGSEDQEEPELLLDADVAEVLEQATAAPAGAAPEAVAEPAPAAPETAEDERDETDRMLDDASGPGEAELELSPDDMLPEPAAAAAPELTEAERDEADLMLDDASGPDHGELELSPDDMLPEEPAAPAAEAGEPAAEPGPAPADLPADAALLGLDLESSQDVDVDALLDQIGDEDIHEALVGRDEPEEPGLPEGFEERVAALVADRVGGLTVALKDELARALRSELLPALKNELAAEIRDQVERAVPREAARIIREEIAALTRELAED